MTEGKKYDDGKARLDLVPKQLHGVYTTFKAIDSLDLNSPSAVSLWCFSQLMAKEPYREPEAVLLGVARILTKGAEVYGEYNWQLVEPFGQRYSNALFRHVTAYLQGEVFCPESGEHHLLHALCNCAFLMWGEDELR